MKSLRKTVYVAAGCNTISLGTGRKEFHPKKPRPALEDYIKEAGKGVIAQIPSADLIDECVISNFMAVHHLVAHNAGFDRRFLDAELQRIGKRRTQEFACSMLAARRLYPDAPNHRLETLVRYKELKTDGVHHRALADAEMTAHLWIRMIDDIRSTFGLREIPFALMQQLARVPRKRVPEFLLSRKSR